MAKVKVLRAKGGTDEREVKLGKIVIPDLWPFYQELAERAKRLRGYPKRGQTP
jgi:hypothetical protein